LSGRQALALTALAEFSGVLAEYLIRSSSNVPVLGINFVRGCLGEVFLFMPHAGNRGEAVLVKNYILFWSKT
jgi:hypothetical protein